MRYLIVSIAVVLVFLCGCTYYGRPPATFDDYGYLNDGYPPAQRPVNKVIVEQPQQSVQHSYVSQPIYPPSQSTHRSRHIRPNPLLSYCPLKSEEVITVKHHTGEVISSACLLIIGLTLGGCGKTYNTTNHYYYYGYGQGAGDKTGNMQGPTVVIPSSNPAVYPPIHRTRPIHRIPQQRHHIR